MQIRKENAGGRGWLLGIRKKMFGSLR